MPLTSEQKEEIMSAYRGHEKDTGSTALQVALLSARISSMTEHLKRNPKDFACRRGLMMLVGQRRRLMNYYKRTASVAAYQSLIQSLGLRK